MNSSSLHVRPYRRGDSSALYDICLLTGDHGADATHLYADPLLLGHVYVGPYVTLAPELAFVLDRGDGTPVGYVLGALDTSAFASRCETEWWPGLRQRYSDPAAVPPAGRTPDQELAASIHRPPPVPPLAARYPSHLHVDLLPEVQGQGYGRALVERLFAALVQAGSPGVHLGVARDNVRARAFYLRLGFTEVSPTLFVRDLPGTSR